MLSLENFAAVKVAAAICNNHQLKKEILCVFGSDYDENETGNMGQRRKQWTEIVEKKAGIMLDKLGLTKKLQQKIIGGVLIVGIRMLIWAKYHEITLGFSRNYSFNFFIGSTFITSRGIIDCKKTAEEMLKDTSLTIKQKYKLVLIYCMNQYIPVLDKQMAQKEKEEFYDSENPSKIQQPDFVKFWSYYFKDEVDKLRGDTDPNVYWLQMAVKSGNKDIVEYCLKQTNLITDESALIYAAQEAVKNYMKGVDDFIVFNCVDFVEDGVWTARDRGVSWITQWVPNHYYTEVMCFLFSKMRQDTQIAFLKKDLKDQEDEHDVHSEVLELFLDFPYQNNFLKTTRLMWDFLPHSSYVKLLRHFTYKIVACKEYPEYGERLFYDYKELLGEFLNKIPEPIKKYVFRDYRIGNAFSFVIHNACRMLLYDLFTQENYTYHDKTIIKWIFDNATNEEKENIISSKTGALTCMKLIQLRRWRITDEFVSNCYTSEEKVHKFKKEFCISEDAYTVCIDFIANEEWHEVETFIRWSTLTDEEINKLKEKMIYSDYGQRVCLKIISHDKKFTAIEKVIKWCFLTEEKAAEFKKRLIVSFLGMLKCKNLVSSDQVELANEFTKWSLSSEEEIKQYKKNVANELGRNVCESFIYSFSGHDFIVGDNRTQQVNCGNWEEVEKFLTWCFTSEDEICNFKKSFTMRGGDGTRNRLIRMHLKLINDNKWEEADTFFTWLNLSVGEIRELRKETILSSDCMRQIYVSVKDTNPKNFLNYAGGKWEKVELFLRWCLEDEYDVLEFKNKYDEVYGFKSYENRGEDIPDSENSNLNQFYLFINEFLNDKCQH